MTSNSEPIGQNDSAPNRGGESDIQTQQSDPRVQSSAPPTQLPPSNAHYYITRKPKKDWWDKHKRWLEILGVVLIAVYTFYTIKMYHANKKAADAAKSAADTAAAALQSSDISFKQELRAYVSTTYAAMSNPPQCSTTQLRVCVDIHFANSGKTPAIGIRTHRYATFGERAENVIKSMKVPFYTQPDGGMLGNVGDQWGLPRPLRLIVTPSINSLTPMNLSIFMG